MPIMSINFNKLFSKIVTLVNDIVPTLVNSSCQWFCSNLSMTLCQLVNDIVPTCQWHCPNLSMTLSQLLSMTFSQLLSMTMSQLVNENVKDDGIDNSITLKMEMMIFLMMMMWWRMIIMKMMRMWITMAVVWTKILQSSVGVVAFNQVLRVYLSTLIKCPGR